MNLYHISFKKISTATWQPKLPDGSVDSPTKDPTGKYPEPSVPRICVAETLTGCFYAVYPNVSQYFEKHNYPHMDFYFYRATIDSNTVKWGPRRLTSRRLVWDAHVTREHVLLTPTKMTLVGKVRFFNTTKDEWVKTNPFDDSNMPEHDVAPPAKYKIIETYGSASMEDNDQVCIDWNCFSDEDLNEGGLGLEKRKSKPKKEGWSDEVTKNEKWHPPAGLFKESPEKIANALKKNSKNRQQAMSRLNFYINRAGDNLSKADRKRLESAKEKLKELYDNEETGKKVSKEELPASYNW